MTALRNILLRQIKSDGPISLADYMATCLLHPDHGYYATRDPFGTAGDFITAPEISQMFGEVLGLCIAQAWLDQGSPTPFVLAELGPGRGTLMRDILRATSKLPGFKPQIVLVEASPALRGIQRETLEGYNVIWAASVADLPPSPLFLVANEFFDALPIRQFVRADNGWSERRVTANGDQLAFALTEPTQVDALAHRLADTKPGDLVEICPSAPAIMSEISGQISNNGGLAIIVDYGDWRSLGDTFQALEAHKPVAPFDRPGEADLTAHVDFEALAHAAVCRVSAMTAQGVLLEQLGITARAQALAKNLSDAALDAHIAAHRRLTHPEEMATLFKAIAISPNGAPLPPGFDQ